MFKEDHLTNSSLDHFAMPVEALTHLETQTALTVEGQPLHQGKALLSQIQTQFFNELTDDAHLSVEFRQKIETWLAQHSLEELQQLNAFSKEYFIYQGITFTVYSESENLERTIPFDLIPRVIAKKQWMKIEAGCKQRIQALNLFLDDIYHGAEILDAGIIPKLQVFSHEAFQPHMLNFQVKGQVYSQISGIDLVRDRSGDFYVLEDNLRTPSGVSYMLESRKISQKIMPELCQANLQGIEHYPILLKQVLAESAYVDSPVIVVLTPGRFNSAYYEHAFLAREMGVPLVTSRDLYVENDSVYVKTIRGKQKVDVIYRRIDDAFLDPLCFRPDSALGVAGLMSAYLKQQVVIANAPGTGVADDKSIYPYVDQMIEFYLGEQAILKNVPTYSCRDQQHLEYVLANMDRLVIKEAQGSGGYGMLIGSQASDADIACFRQKLIAAPHAYIAQPILDLSITPTLTQDGIAARHVDLRPFILSSPERTEIVPGGLTRVAMQKDSLVVNSSQGGGIKDTWILDQLHN